MASSPRYQQIVDALLDQQKRIQSPLRLRDEHALAQSHGVSRDTIRRALKVLESREAIVRRPRHGTYLQPLHPQVQGIRHQVIGFIPPWWADSLSAGHTASVLEGISRWSDEQGCHLAILHNTQSSPEPDHVWLKRVRDRKLAGLIWLSPQSQQMALVKRMAQILPVVIVGVHQAGRDIYHVSPDYEQAVRLIDGRLTGLGHDQYGVVNTDIMGSYSQTWIRALHKAWAKRGQVFDHTRHFLDIRPFMRSMLPTLLLDYYLPAIDPIKALVLMSSSYLQAVLAHEPFRQRIGRDLSLITIDMGQQPMQAYLPGYSFDHIDCRWSEVGRQAALRLAQLIAGQRVPHHLALPVDLVEGQSCVPCEAGTCRP